MTRVPFRSTTAWVASAFCCVVSVANALAEEEDWGDNIVLNPSFESGKTGWDIRRAARLSRKMKEDGKVTVATIQLDDQTAHTGHSSLRFDSDASISLWHAVESEPIAVHAGKQYRLSAWVKTDKVRQEGEQYYNSNAYVRFTDTSEQEVKIGKLRLRATERLLGTNDWSYVEQVVTAPEGAELAYVGCVLTCSGTAWFDDIALQQHAGFPWKTRETDRFLMHFEESEDPSESDIADLEAHLGRIEEQLGIRHPRKIHYYKYASTERKKSLTGNASNAHYETNAVHADSWQDRHEIVHVIAPALGESVAFLEEGLAVHLAGPWGGHDLHSYAKVLAGKDELLPIGQLLDNRAFRTFPAEVTYPQAGSFVRYLIDLFGMDRFKKLYPVQDKDSAMATVTARFAELYGLDIHEAEEAWHKFLVPPGAKPGEVKPGFFRVDPSETGTP